MARSVVFTHDPTSHIYASGDYLFDRTTVPYTTRRRMFEKEKPQVEWGHYIGFFEEEPWHVDWRNFRHLREMRKPLILWLQNYIKEIERRIPFEDVGLLSWKFNFYIYQSETEEAIRYSVPAWFVEITDPENRIVHKNWTIMIDYEGDLTIKRGVATDNDPMSINSFNFWKNAEGRLIDAIYAHLHLRDLARQRTKK